MPNPADFHEDQDIRIDTIQARGFILKGDQVLMMQRRKNGQEYFVFPGGHMEQGETPLQTAVREIKEETTIKCQNMKLVLEVVDYIWQPIQHEYYFTGEWLSGEPTLSGEEVGRNSSENSFHPLWIDISKLPELTIYPICSKAWAVENLHSR